MLLIMMTFNEKILLFQSLCLCSLDYLCIWKSFSNSYIAYVGWFETTLHKCMKNFFRFALCDSVTDILAYLGLPNFDNLLLCGMPNKHSMLSVVGLIIVL